MDSPLLLGGAAGLATMVIDASLWAVNGSEGHTVPDTDHSADTTWRSQEYTTALFGNLATGTGLMVDLGSQITITRARITVGAIRGADVQLRLGDSRDSLNSLRIVARVSPPGGVTEIPVAPAAAGRYLLIWFTRLPPLNDGSGKFQAAVREVTTYGCVDPLPSQSG